MSDIHYALTVDTAPTVEPFTTAEAKSHLRVDVTDDDTLIDNLVTAARTRMETDTGRALTTQTWDLVLDSFPDDDDEAIKIPKAPLQSVTSITYVDTDGATQTWDSSKYIVDTDSEPGRITPAYSESYPTTREQVNAVTIKFQCGYGDASTDIPDDLLQAMRMLIGHWYEHREAVQSGVAVNTVPMAYKFLRIPYVIWGF